MPILNRYKKIGSTKDVDFKTVKPCFGTTRSHINLVASDTQTWEQSAAFRLEQAANRGIVSFYAKNDHMEFVIPYEYFGVGRAYTPDFIVRLQNRPSNPGSGNKGTRGRPGPGEASGREAVDVSSQQLE